MTSESFRKTTLIILSFLLAWAVIAAARVFFYTVAEQDHYLAESRKIAWRETVIPFVRGAILDRNGKVLAQTSLQYDLVIVSFPKKPKMQKTAEKRIRRIFPDTPEILREGVVLKRDLGPEEVVRLTKKCRILPWVGVKGIPVRKVHPEPAVAAVVGKTAFNDAGDMVGISGLERDQDMVLSGENGRASVMLDRYGAWCAETLRILRFPVNGKDHRAKFSIEELLKNKGGQS